MISKQTFTGSNPLSMVYVTHKLYRPLAERLRSRQHVGPYVCTRPDTALRARIMYQSDGMTTGDGPVQLRLEWCDAIVNIKHNGHYIDEDQWESYRGVVARLPASRGYLAGYSMGEGMLMRLDTDIYDDIESAAYAADSMAEYAAESD